jgi:hypothetical protein
MQLRTAIFRSLIRLSASGLRAHGFGSRLTPNLSKADTNCVQEMTANHTPELCLMLSYLRVPTHPDAIIRLPNFNLHLSQQLLT